MELKIAGSIQRFAYKNNVGDTPLYLLIEFNVSEARRIEVEQTQ